MINKAALERAQTKIIQALSTARRNVAAKPVELSFTVSELWALAYKLEERE